MASAPAISLIPSPVDYFEKQIDAQCGLCALNHVLQEEKIVYDEENPDEIIQNVVSVAGLSSAPDPKNNDSEINLSAVCDSLNEEHKSLGLDTASLARLQTSRLEDLKALNSNNDEPINNCYQGGWFSAELLIHVLKNLLDYRVDIKFGPITTRNFLDENFIGAIIAEGGIHYTAISPFLNRCYDRNTSGRLVSKKYAYMDSYESGGIKCYDTERVLCDTLNRIKTITAVIYIFKKEESYKSEAVIRLLSEKRRVENVRQARNTRRKGGSRHKKRHSIRQRNLHHSVSQSE